MQENTLRKVRTAPDEYSANRYGNLDYRALLEAAPDAIVVTNANGDILEMNEEVTHVFGHHRNELIGKNLEILIPERFRAQHKGHHEIYRQDPHTREMGSGMDLYGLHKDGREFSIEVSLSPYQSADEILTIAAVRDITERKQHEQAIQSANDSLRNWLEGAPILAVMLDCDRRVTFSNEYVRWLTGWSQEELLGEDWFEKVVPADTRTDSRKLITDGLSSGTLEAITENEIVDKSGGRHLIAWHRSLLRNGEGQVTGVTGLGVDITERSRTEHYQSMLLNELNHRVKNTMTVVNSIARLSLVNASDLQSFKDSFLKRMHALSSVHQLLTQASWNQVDFMDMVHKALAPFEIEKERIRIDGVAGTTIPARLAQSLYLVLHELATNAVKYGSLSCDEGKVHISWNAPNGEDPQLFFQWAERAGPPVAKPRETGFGTKLIKQIVACDENASVDLDFAREGLRATFRIPLSS